MKLYTAANFAPLYRCFSTLHAPAMPKRTDLSTILIIGSGPIVIGQGCEFDYSGTQACKALREEGYKVVLVNSNPATIMTDPEFADCTYIEPITPEAVEKIIARHNTAEAASAASSALPRIDAVLPHPRRPDRAQLRLRPRRAGHL